MTPAEQDKDLRDSISSIIYGADWKTELGEDAHLPQTEAIMEIVRKQTLEMLDRLEKSMLTAEQLTTKYGYYMPDKKQGYRLALHDIIETIEDERKKLNDHR